MKHEEVRFCPSFERLVNAANTAHIKNSHADGGRVSKNDGGFVGGNKAIFGALGGVADGGQVKAKNKGGKCSGIDKLVRMEKAEHMGKKHKR